MTTRRKSKKKWWYSIDPDWRKWQVPLGALATVVLTLAGVWAYANDTFLRVTEYVQDRLFDRQIQVSKEQRTLAVEVIRLESQPAKTDADKAILNLKKDELRKVNDQLQNIEQQMKRK
jgi:hypothetical protein